MSRYLRASAFSQVLLALALAGASPSLAFAAGALSWRLQQAIAFCDVERARALLERGADPNATDRQGKPILKWLASGRGCTDSTALATAKLLEKNGARFEGLDGGPGPGLLVNLAPRKLPETVAFLCRKMGVDPNTLEAKPVKAAKPIPPPREYPCQGRQLTLAQVRLLSQLGLPNASRLAGLAGAMNCKLIEEQGDLLLIDCNSAADGPAYYIDQAKTALVATCGGACMRGCTGCPPPGWKGRCAR